MARALSVADAPAAIYASPFPRANATAAPLADQLGIQRVLDSRLEEYALANTTLTEAEDRADLVLWRSEHRGVPGGETLRDFSVRVAAFCEEIVERHLGSRVVAFTHSGSIDAVLRWAVGLPPESPWHHDFEVSNASITELRCWPHGRALGGAPRYAAIGRVGATGHLGPLASDL